MTTSNDPDDIRRDIERTRANLSSDVNALADEAKPGNVVKRQVEGVKEGAQNLKERVFGSDDDYYAYDSGPNAMDRAQYKAGELGDRAQQVGEDARQAVQGAPRQLKQRTRGNPLAAGLIAFGAGALLGSLIPSSRREQQVAADLKDKAQPLVNAAKEAAQDAAQTLKPQAQEAVETVKASATDSAQAVQEQGRVQAQDVKDHAQVSAQDVKDHAQTSADDVRGHAQGAAGDVRGHAQGAADDVKTTAQSDSRTTGTTYDPGYTDTTTDNSPFTEPGSQKPGDDAWR